MELAPHDLLKIQDGNVLEKSQKHPAWVDKVLRQVPFVVVRRAPLQGNLIPIGVRGETRQDRFGGFLADTQIMDKITPEDLVRRKTWRQTPRFEKLRIFQLLESVDMLLLKRGFAWGPVGSVGFELATGMPVVSDTSDLDMVIRCPQLVRVCEAVQLVQELAVSAVFIDVQLETSYGGVSLLEYARGTSPVLLRTVEGVKLTGNPWNDKELGGELI